MVIDFDQLLAKQPGRDDAVFAWHQDQAYWIDTDDRRTATCWLAVDDSTVENGCMQFLPGSHREPVRPHHPLHGDRDASHTLVTELRAGDEVVPVPIARGDITVHSEGVLHGSGGNTSADSWRRAVHRRLPVAQHRRGGAGARVHALAQRRRRRARAGRRVDRRAVTAEPDVRSNVDLYAALLQGRMRGDDALEASQKLLQVLMDSSANAVFWKDRQSRYLGCNRVFAAFAGTEPDDLIGKSDRDMPWADDAEFGADWFMDWDAHVAETGEPVVGIVERLRRAGGDLRWVETQKVPLRDLDGEVIGILGTFEDVTERRAAEERLNGTLKDLDKRVQQRTRDLERAIESLRREVDDRVRVQAEERQQRAYAEALRDTASAMSKTLDANEVMEQVLIGVERLVSNDLTAIVLVGADERLEIARCRVGFGYPKPTEDAADRRARRIADGDPRAARRPGDGDHRRAAPSASDPPARCSVRRCRWGIDASGSSCWRASPRGSSRPPMPSGCGRSPTRRRRRSPTPGSSARPVSWPPPRSANACPDELHDAVNQTLWTASLTADSVLRDVEEGSELHRRLQRLRTLTSGAQAEMRTLLLELRPQELVEVDLHELLGHLVAAMECRKKVEVTVELEPIELDPAQRVAFYRIAQEALTNITRHSAASVVSLTLRRRTDAKSSRRLELRIVDNGRGFDVDNVPPGHLGLSIMRERAEAVGADLQSCGRTRPRDRSDRVAAGMTSITVLVVDDHDLLREGVSSCLSAFDDLEVIGEAASGEEGLDAAVAAAPDVVVIDLIMPGIGGVEAIRQMRAADESIGLLALSTFAHGDLIREAIDAGASGYLVKSVDTGGLAQAVRDVAAGSGSFSTDVTRVLAASDRVDGRGRGAVHRAGGRGGRR